MKRVLWLLPLVIVAAACNQAGSAETRPLSDSDKKQLAQNEPVKQDPVTKTTPTKEEHSKETTPTRPGGEKIDPVLLGSYKFVITPEQEKSYQDSVAQIKKDIQSGNKDAQSALQTSEMAYNAAKNMVVTLKADGRYHADFGGGNADGKFTVTGTKVLLTPDVPSTDPGAPKDVLLEFDKKSKQLVVDFQGSKMYFVKK